MLVGGNGDVRLPLSERARPGQARKTTAKIPAVTTFMKNRGVCYTNKSVNACRTIYMTTVKEIARLSMLCTKTEYIKNDGLARTEGLALSLFSAFVPEIEVSIEAVYVALMMDGKSEWSTSAMCTNVTRVKDTAKAESIEEGINLASTSDTFSRSLFLGNMSNFTSFGVRTYMFVVEILKGQHVAPVLDLVALEQDPVLQQGFRQQQHQRLVFYLMEETSKIATIPASIISNNILLVSISIHGLAVLQEREQGTASLNQPRTVDDDTQRRALIDKKPNRFADLLSNKITSANSDSGQPAVDTAVSGLTAMRYSTAADKIPLQNLIKACKWFARKVRGVEAMAFPVLM
ncbi:hypothetical protein HBI56_221340 [Parastagonospora nodorum]|nr:hypothetical protein HBI09_215120 [Parastagonospora nodorum]KAH4216870.1 hypothetical protein HBI06_222880 [Parastagonospora nodorum]KAH4226190.1 hypothetical protein HBI05_224550 [Parastagonospora nodorum]KAH4335484.1 hypothetical protein HBH98_234290 [Parastagonospora nodorum]KAH4358229.1 hypothetical protein HBH97_219510 [Parastagonospora nodorum]